MRGLIRGLTEMIYRHRVAFAVATTFTVIGIFSGIFFVRETESGFTAEAVRTQGFFGLWLGFLLPNGIFLLGTYLLGSWTVTACCAEPFVLIGQGFAIGKLWTESVYGLSGLIEWVTVVLVSGVLLAVVSVLAGMAALSMREKKERTEGYQAFMMALGAVLLAVSLYYALGRVCFGLI